jgi:hypothetical protein
MAVYHTTDLSTSLTKAEREVVLTIADDESAWHVFTDSQRLSGRLKKLAAAWGITPERLGHGWVCSLPLRAISFRAPTKPPTDRQRAAGRALAAKSRPTDTAASLRMEGPVC